MVYSIVFFLGDCIAGDYRIACYSQFRAKEILTERLCISALARNARNNDSFGPTWQKISARFQGTRLHVGKYALQ